MIAGHRGQVCLLEIGAQLILVFQGRLHYYEGYSRAEVVANARLAAELGTPNILLTNAAGGIGPEQVPGSLMAVRDQIAANRPDWWRSPSPGGIGPLLPSPYAPRLVNLIQEAAVEAGHAVSIGTYAGVTGPNYETPAEVRALRALGADAVGMSTVDEADAAAALGLEVAAISCIANRATGLAPGPLTHAEVLATVSAAANKMERVVHRLLAHLCV